MFASIMEHLARSAYKAGQKIGPSRPHISSVITRKLRLVCLALSADLFANRLSGNVDFAQQNQLGR